VTEDEERYAAAWRRYRLWFWLSLASMAAFATTFVLGAVNARALDKDPTALRAVGALLAALFVGQIVALTLLRSWKCPRCGHVWVFNNGVQGRSCRRCGLNKWATDPNL
jgi:ribosomal protein S27AE